MIDRLFLIATALFITLTVAAGAIVPWLPFPKEGDALLICARCMGMWGALGLLIVGGFLAFVAITKK